MFKELCATLFLLCNPILNVFDFNYNINPRDEQQANRLEDATADQKKKLKIQSDKSDQAY